MSHLTATLERYAAKRLTPVTMGHLVAAVTEPQSAYVNHSLKQELCIRLAHQLKRLRMLPHVRPIDQLLRVHKDTFETMLQVKGSQHSSGDDFYRSLTAVQDRHATNVETLMDGKKLMAETGNQPGVMRIIDEFMQSCRRWPTSPHSKQQPWKLSRFSVVGAEPLPPITAYAEMPQLFPEVAEGEDEIVWILPSLISVLRKSSMSAIARAPRSPLLHLGAVTLGVHCDADTTASPRLLRCVPSHVHHVLFETLKNALRATVGSHKKVTDTLPPVRIHVIYGKTETTILVQDEGGGLARHMAIKAFQYLWTSSESFADVEEKHRAIHSFQPVVDPLCGMGIGLPVSRLYARHLGGDLRMLSAEGYGTTVALYLPVADLPEVIPLMWDDSLPR
ncbi:histidine kinase-like ATPase [Tribonema minus]|uniref:Protein-serine/threonine kinase n=1 Tax=Tribonema minus TaxID=303371 RepID=A0A835YM41_9STRA|nr:histidine kinase-like ATPase [Tribonema minus]